jgi:Chaperone of endosialidase
LFNDFGNNNIAIGTRALDSSFSGNNNIAIGLDALTGNRSGNNNIGIGLRVGETLGSALGGGNDNIYLGNEVDAATSDESGVMRLGAVGVQERTFIAGIVSSNVDGSAVRINSNGRLGIRMSSARYKHDIQPMGVHSQGLLQLRPVTFRYKQDMQGERQYGLIAEEVAEVYPELVMRGANGEIETVRYEELIPMLLNELQQQQQELGAQARQLAELKAQNESLRVALVQQNAELAARLARLEERAARTTTSASR